ncbi:MULTISPECIES: adenylate/guanylate cyclase domain-containing protein [unclassified Roseofilum]|uniref:adenylate/guanylate cyclase domain-containing protein n=1 Tax=unclassified Roseofilum TaxID=2620099 RepID=UPI001B26891C|nr:MULTISPECIES: adenylate/guanylate cyclase domain-containing protein [unclassified Roseofilum]MBP0009959.1 PAS domain S-box protein [Roseofilum sp. Belize Diploria]MBP0034355.1 PAS domain S-box protein [Roseofilum sp. Belize BBD 4]
MSKTMVPKHLEYAILDRELIILDFSDDADRLVGGEDPLKTGESFQFYFPETYGIEEILELIVLGEQDGFDIKAISRSSDVNHPLYVDLYFIANPHSEGFQELIVFLEDVTERMNLEQSLVQATNENSIVINALAKSENYIQQLIHSMAEALIVTNHLGEIKTVNPAVYDLLEYSKEELIGKPIRYLLGDHPLSHEWVSNEKFLQGEVLTDIEVLIPNKRGEKLSIAFSCAALDTDVPTLKDILYVGRDITKTKQAQKRLYIQYSVARVLSRSLMLDEALPNILRVLVENLEWDMGVYWIPKQIKDRNDNLIPTNRLLRQTLWKMPEAEFPQLSKLTEATLTLGEGWLGKIYRDNQPRWITHIELERETLQKELGAIEKVNAIVGFPVSSDEDKLGMITLFSQATQPMDEELVQMLAGIGNQLCQFIKRKKIEISLFYQKKQTEKLLHNILPVRIAELLKQTAGAIAEYFEEVTVLFADIVGFTKLSEEKTASELVALLNRIFSKFDQLTEDYRLEKIKTIGDAYMVVGGLPTPRHDHAEAIANMALKMQEAMAELNQDMNTSFQIRIGVNSGPVVAGVIGKKKFSYDLWGDTVNTASRMESHGIPGQIQVTRTTYEALKLNYYLQHRGKINIKGKGEMDTYMLTGKRLNP